MTRLLFTNARVFDGLHADCAEGVLVLIDGERNGEVVKQRL